MCKITALCDTLRDFFKYADADDRKRYSRTAHDLESMCRGYFGGMRNRSLLFCHFHPRHPLLYCSLSRFPPKEIGGREYFEVRNGSDLVKGGRKIVSRASPPPPLLPPPPPPPPPSLFLLLILFLLFFFLLFVLLVFLLLLLCPFVSCTTRPHFARNTGLRSQACGNLHLKCGRQ